VSLHNPQSVVLVGGPALYPSAAEMNKLTTLSASGNQGPRTRAGVCDRFLTESQRATCSRKARRQHPDRWPFGARFVDEKRERAPPHGVRLAENRNPR
jgi:hypothetical protein